VEQYDALRQVYGKETKDIGDSWLMQQFGY
jgi:hypothetical protein